VTSAVVVLVAGAIAAETLAVGLVELGLAIRAVHRRLTQTGAMTMTRIRLAGLVLVAGAFVLGACASEADENPLTGEPVGEEPTAVDEPAEGPITNSGNEENPPTADVTLTRCEPDDFGFAVAGGVITNNSSEPSTYSITVEVVDGAGVRYGEGYAGSSAVAPGQQVEWESFGAEELRPGSTCNVTQVERFAS
jgi:hypothetical protein